MSLTVKICGITDAEALKAAIEDGAAYAGFVFYENSPRFLSIGAARALAERVPKPMTPVGLFVDPTDEEVRAVLREVPLGMIQLHGDETPSRVAALTAMTGLPIMKALGVASAADLDRAKDYTAAAMLLFDAKPAQDAERPGGNATAFDWGLLQGRDFGKPWLLAGGLNADNLAEAVRQSGARGVDVSSGVEDRPAHKDPVKIREFMDMAKRL